MNIKVSSRVYGNLWTCYKSLPLAWIFETEKVLDFVLLYVHSVSYFRVYINYDLRYAKCLKHKWPVGQNF